MEEFWNQQNLVPPATNSISYKAEEQTKEQYYDAFNVLAGISSQMRCLDEVHHYLEIDATMLKRQIYKACNAFRCDKRLKMMKKINTCLNRYKELNLIDVFQKLQDIFPGDKHITSFVPRFSSAVYVPSQQMYEYALARCVGSAALLSRCASLCMDFFLYIRQILALAHYFASMAVLAATISRIWVLCHHLITKLDGMYVKLFKAVQVLNASPKPWIPEGSSLPESLKEFKIRIESSNVEEMMDKEAKDSADFCIDKLWDENSFLGDDIEEEEDAVNGDDDDDANINHGSHENEINPSLGKEKSTVKSFTNEDIGVAITRVTKPIVEEKEDIGVKITRVAKPKTHVKEDVGMVISHKTKTITEEKSCEVMHGKSKKRKKEKEGIKTQKRMKVEEESQSVYDINYTQEKLSKKKKVPTATLR